MTKQIDVCGLECPQPVVRTKKALEEMGAGVLEIRLDSEISFENVTRFVHSLGHQVETGRDGEFYKITVTCGPTVSPEAAKDDTTCVIPGNDYIVYVADRYMGVGDEKLGEVLMRGFLKTLLDVQPLPGKILFVNSGIFLTTEGSVVLDSLRTLEKEGVMILSCGTCLDFYNRKELLQVGNATNMFEIVESLKNAAKVLRP